MRHRAATAVPALAIVLAACAGVSGCTSGATAGTAGTTAGGTPASPASASASASSAFVGPAGPDPACASALKAEKTLQAKQGKDQKNESALDQDFTNYASALNAAARQEKHPATAKVMTTLASDFTALVESQSGAAQLPGMDTIQNDGAALDKACG